MIIFWSSIIFFVDNLASILLEIVSKATVEVGVERSVKVVKATGTKCPRCWNYSTEADENGLCPRCQAVMKAEK